MESLTEFRFEGNVVRTFGTKKEPWFAATDVFKVMGTNITKTMEKLDDDEKMTETDLWLISEPGLYRIIFRSDKPKARAFARFVTHEALPSIREYGFYVNPKWGKIPKGGKWTLKNGEQLTALQVQQKALEIGCCNVDDRRIQSLVDDIDYYNGRTGIERRYPYADRDIQKMSRIGIGQEADWYECFIPESADWGEYCYWDGNERRYSEKFAELVKQVDEKECRRA